MNKECAPVGWLLLWVEDNDGDKEELEQFLVPHLHEHTHTNKQTHPHIVICEK